MDWDTIYRKKRNRRELFESIEKNGSNFETALNEGLNEINVRGQYGNTLLYQAVYFNRYEMAKIILQKGVDVALKGLMGTALHAACCDNNYRRTKKIVSLLLEYNVPVNAKNKSGATALWYAEYYNPKGAELIKNNGGIKVPETYQYKDYSFDCEICNYMDRKNKVCDHVDC